MWGIADDIVYIRLSQGTYCYVKSQGHKWVNRLLHPYTMCLKTVTIFLLNSFTETACHLKWYSVLFVQVQHTVCLLIKSHLNTAVTVQHYVPFFVSKVLTDKIRHGAGSKHKPALSPIFPFVSLFHHIALKRETIIESLKKMWSYHWHNMLTNCREYKLCYHYS